MLNRRDKIKALRKALEDGNIMTTAYNKVKVSPASVCQWKKKIHFDRLTKLLEAARERGQGRRDSMVEDAQFKKLVSGEASGNEYEFYLCNRVPERWKKLKDNTVVVQNTINNEAAPSGNNGTFTGEDNELTSSIRAKLFPNIPAQ